jgi:hypothetical protein
MQQHMQTAIKVANQGHAKPALSVQKRGVIERQAGRVFAASRKNSAVGAGPVGLGRAAANSVARRTPDAHHRP